MGHPLRSLWWGVLPLCVAGAVVARQAKPFAIVSDDRSYYSIATAAAARFHQEWPHRPASALKGFLEASSVKGDLPPHISRKRPLLLWVWSAALALGGHAGLVWVWRLCFVSLALTLFLVLTDRCSAAVAGVASSVAVVTPAIQGLLSWMSYSTYLVGYPLLLLGIWLLRRGRPWVRLLGLPTLALAMMAREVIYFLVATAVAADLWVKGKRRLAGLMPVMALAVWVALPEEDRSVLSSVTKDLPLVLRSSLTILAAHGASVVRNVGLPLLALCAIASRLTPWVVAASVLAFLLPPAAILLPWVVCAACAKRESLLGVVWAVVAASSLCLYGSFTSRYAMEPLLGLVLAAAPAVGARSKLLRGALLAACLWQGGSLVPDAVNRVVPSALTFSLDQRFWALDLVTRWRHYDWVTFAGRAKEPWHVLQGWVGLSPGGEPVDLVRASGPYLRLTSGLNLHCPATDDVVATRRGLWEWNVWYWRVIPARKAAGVHLEGPEGWQVHTLTPPPHHRRCRRVVPGTPHPRWPTPHEALDSWIQDTPEVMNRPRVEAWLKEVWDSECGCPPQLSLSSFRELELGRLLVRDDGWLDLGELAFLRRVRVRCRAGESP